MSATAKDYITTIVWLAILTIIEVYIYIELDLGLVNNLITVVVIGVIKVWFIVAYFMHLKWDAKRVAYLPYVPLPFMTIMFVVFVLTH